VRGRASRRKERDEFTFPEVLNETADERQSPNSRRRMMITGPNKRLVLSVLVDTCGELRYCCTASDLISYWGDRFHWSESQVALVDLLGTQKAIEKMSSDAQRRVQKLRCGWLPVNPRVSREDPDRLNGCSALFTQ
jgi:hypothetical protein